MHLVGFVIRIHHDAQSSECQIHTVVFCVSKKAIIIYFWILTANWGCQHAWKPNYNYTFLSWYVWEWIPVFHMTIRKIKEDQLFQYQECRQTLRKDSSSRRPVRRPYAYDLSQEDLLHPVKRMKTISRAVCKDVHFTFTFRVSRKTSVTVSTCLLPHHLLFKKKKILEGWILMNSQH